MGHYRRHYSDPSQFETRIAGIPCQIKVTYVEPRIRGCRSGHPDNRTEDEGGEVEFDVLDRRGYLAPWLANKLGGQELQRIQSEILQGETP